MRPQENPQMKVLSKKICNYVYDINKKIGDGSYSNVYLGHEETTNQMVAVKVMNLHHLKRNRAEELVQNEIAIMKEYPHSNIVKLYDVFQTANNLYMIMEYCNQGDLRMELKRRKRFPEKEAVEIVREIVKTYKFLLEKNVMHRDLKPDNILILNGNLKLCDFGFAQKMKYRKEVYQTEPMGTPLYCSPQGLQEQKYTAKSDVWSLGIMFYELLFGQAPWPCINLKDLIKNILTQPLRIPNFIKINDNTKDFIIRCLHLNEEQRLDWEDVYNHPLFGDYFKNTEKSTTTQDVTPKTTPNIITNNISTTNNNQQQGPLSQQQNITPSTTFSEQIQQIQQQQNQLPTQKKQQPQQQATTPTLLQQIQQPQQQQPQQQNVFIKPSQPLNDLSQNSPQLAQMKHQKSLEDVAGLAAQQIQAKFAYYQKTDSIECIEDFRSNDQAVKFNLDYIQFILNLEDLLEKISTNSLVITQFNKQKIAFILAKHKMMKVVPLQKILRSDNKENELNLISVENYINQLNFQVYSSKIIDYYTKSVKKFSQIQNKFQKNIESSQNFVEDFNSDYGLNRIFESQMRDSLVFYEVLVEELRQLVREINHLANQHLKTQLRNQAILMPETKYEIKFLIMLVQYFKLCEKNKQFFEEGKTLQQKIDFDQSFAYFQKDFDQQSFQDIRKEIYEIQI